MVVSGIVVILTSIHSLIQYENSSNSIRTELLKSQNDFHIVDPVVVDQVVEKAVEVVMAQVLEKVEKRVEAFVLEHAKGGIEELIQGQVTEQLEERLGFIENIEMFNGDAVEYEETVVAPDEAPNEATRQAATTNDSIMTNTMSAGKALTSATSERRIPNVLVAGVQRGGTTTISNYLHDEYGACFSVPRMNQNVEMDGKEPHFFDEMYHKGLHFYQNIYEQCSKTPILMDGTPETMLYPELVRTTYEEQGSADTVKIIFILREPVDREFSWYNHRARRVNETVVPNYAKDLLKEDGSIKNFNEDIKDRLFFNFRNKRHTQLYGVYAALLKRWFAVFSREQILVLAYDEMVFNQPQFLARVHQFLELPEKHPPAALPKANASVRKQEMTPELCTFLKYLSGRFFEKRNNDLYKLLDEIPGPEMEQRPFPKFLIRCTEG